MSRKRDYKHLLKSSYKKNERRKIIRDILLVSQKDKDELAMLYSSDDITRLFVENPVPTAPIVNTTNSSNDVVVSNGYVSTAVFLLSIISYANDNLVRDSYLLPALFCFRMYLEQSVKDTLVRYGVKVEEIKGSKGHDLSVLWNKLKSFIYPFDKTCEQVENVINEINSVDSDSTAFRYPHHLNTLYAKSDIEPINTSVDIFQMQKTMLQLYRFFEGINDEAIENCENHV